MLEAHGMAVELDRQGDTLLLTIKIYGDIAYDDFMEMETRVEQALEEMDTPKIKALINMIDFNHWETMALWEDIVFTRKYAKAFTRVAIVGVDLRERLMAKIAQWFIEGELKYFEKTNEARAWLEGDSVHQAGS
ncbi:SpoIIAA family protein [Zobellella maritima]|uniref:STAS/SEC14 domain-containing protein n=1 Tax=Zobellella maritima TaxID=2059725 RepID=UPI000E30493E|nr:STAS/SEC14 domain-containing protein [Zobellella maritima]